MKTFNSSSRKWLQLRGPAIVIGSLSIAAVGFAAAFASAPALHAARAKTVAATAADTKAWLAAVSLTPASLAAAGVAGEQASGMLTAATDFISGMQSDPGSLRTAVASASAEVDRLSKLVQSGQAEPEDFESLATARASLTQTQAALDTFHQQLFDASIQSLPEAKRQALATIRSQWGREVPVTLLVVAHSDSEWKAIRDAITTEKQSQRRGVAVPAQAASLLASVRSDPAVVNADSSYAELLPALKAVWTTGN